MTDEIVYSKCPNCKIELQVILASPGPREAPKGAVGNGLLADLKPWTDQGTITIDQRANPIVIRMPYDPTDEGRRKWAKINTIINKYHKDAWIKAGKQSRWEIPA